MPGLKTFCAFPQLRNLPRRRLFWDTLEESVHPQLDLRDQFFLAGLRFLEQGAPVFIIPQKHIECRKNTAGVREGFRVLYGSGGIIELGCYRSQVLLYSRIPDDQTVVKSIRKFL